MIRFASSDIAVTVCLQPTLTISTITPDGPPCDVLDRPLFYQKPYPPH